MLVALTATGGGTVYAYSAYQDGAGPSGAVRAYFDALARGDAPAALATGLLPAGDHAYLTTTVLREQLSIAPLREISIGAVERTGNSAKVNFSYGLHFAAGTQQVTDTIGVTLSRGRWRLDAVAVAGRFFLNEAVNRSSFAGTEIPAPTTLLFPGAVPLTFDTPYLRLSLASRSVRLSDTGAIELTAQLAGGAGTVLRANLVKQLAACVKGAAAPANCPLPSSQYVPGSLNGTVKLDQSNLLLDLNLDPVGSVEITGQATFSGKYRVLTFDNVGADHTGKLTLNFNATAYVVPPLTVRFEGGS